VARPAGAGDRRLALQLARQRQACRLEFDPGSGLECSGKGHYPQALVSTLYDVKRRLPLARCVGSIHQGEREQARQLLARAPRRSIVLLDRGYPAFELLEELLAAQGMNFLMRGPASNTFSEINAFVASGQQEALLDLAPSNTYLDSLSAQERRQVRDKRLRLRAVRLVSPDGQLSVLLSDLLDREAYPAQALRELYWERWRIEEHYRMEKVVLDVERFHGRSPQAVRQELYAAAIMSVLGRLLTALAAPPSKNQPQLKHALAALTEQACLLAAEQPAAALAALELLLERIGRIRYYPPKKKRPSQPRTSKQAPNKWCLKNRSHPAKT